MEHRIDYLSARVDALQRRIEELEKTIEFKNAQLDVLTQNFNNEFNK